MATILIVDDMAVFREPIAIALQSQGYDVSDADSGLSALRVLQNGKIDLVLLDINMPEMDAFDFLRIIRRNNHWRDIPVLLFTAMGNKQLVMKAKEYGVRDFILKSQLTLSGLVSRIERCLNNGEVSDDPEEICNKGKGKQIEHLKAQQSTQVVCQTKQEQDFKSLKPLLTRSELDARMEDAGELKAMSPSVGQLMKLTQSKNCSVEHVAKAIKHDQAIALKILKLANSAVYSRGEPVDTIQNAVMRIGLKEIRQAVMNIAVIDRFGAGQEHIGKWINVGAFWEHSIATGLIAAKLARLLGEKGDMVDAMFTAGLLHDVGRMVLIEQFGEEYSKVLEAANALQLPLERVEKRMLLVDHADIMDRLLHKWKFAKIVLNPIAMHHLSVTNARGLAPKSLREICILGFANRISHSLGLGSSGNNVIYPTHDFTKYLKVSDHQVSEILSNVADEAEDLKLAMLQASTNMQFVNSLEGIRSAIDAPVRIAFFGDYTGQDAYFNFSKTVSDPTLDVPNLAVAHLQSGTDRRAIAASLTAFEKEAQCGILPLILISNKGDLTIDTTDESRPIARLPIPTPISQFCATINRLLFTSTAQAA